MASIPVFDTLFDAIVWILSSFPRFLMVCYKPYFPKTVLMGLCCPLLSIGLLIVLMFVRMPVLVSLATVHVGVSKDQPAVPTNEAANVTAMYFK